MILADVLHILLEDGISEARLAYAHPVHRDVLDGAVDGYEACRDKEPREIIEVLAVADLASLAAREGSSQRMAYHESYASRVRYVAAVMSCALEYHGLPSLTRITFQGRARYAAIVGWEHSDSMETNGVNRR